MRIDLLQLSRYGLIGLLTYAVDMGSFLALLGSGLADGPVVANLGAKAVAGVFSFAMHRRVTFKLRDREGLAAQALRYFGLLLINAPLSSAILWMLLAVLPSPSAAKIAADVIVIGASYLLARHVVFR